VIENRLVSQTSHMLMLGDFEMGAQADRQSIDHVLRIVRRPGSESLESEERAVLKSSYGSRLASKQVGSDVAFLHEGVTPDGPDCPVEDAG
jgi:hypothetical protein